MAQKLACPKCSAQVSTKPLKTWRFGKYDVGRYECGKCGGKFNLYNSPKAIFTIPKPSSPK